MMRPFLFQEMHVPKGFVASTGTSPVAVEHGALVAVR
jgi:hypothetical protein